MLPMVPFVHAGEEFVVPSSGEDVGAVLFTALMQLLPNGTLDLNLPPSFHQALGQASKRAAQAAVAGGPGQSQAPIDYKALSQAATQAGTALQSLPALPMMAAPALCIIVALRNMLAHSAAGKIAALKAQVHMGLMRTCDAGQAILTAMDLVQSARKGGGTLGSSGASLGIPHSTVNSAPGGSATCLVHTPNQMANTSVLHGSGGNEACVPVGSSVASQIQGLSGWVCCCVAMRTGK